MVLFNVLYKVGLPLKSVDETLACDISNELSCTFMWPAVCYAGKSFTNILSLRIELLCLTIRMISIEQ